MAQGASGFVGPGEHRLTLLDELHRRALRLQPFDSAPQQLAGTVQPDGTLELAVGHVPEAVLVAEDAHESLGFAVVGSDLFIRDGPFAIIARSEAQAVSRPAERPAAQLLQPAVAGTISDR